MNPQIEKGVPIPENYMTRNGTMTGLLKSMEIGDSIVFPKEKRNSVLSAARSVRVKAAIRTINENEFRFWRTA